jgi:hypothetical protein
MSRALSLYQTVPSAGQNIEAEKDRGAKDEEEMKEEKGRKIGQTRP